MNDDATTPASPRPWRVIRAFEDEPARVIDSNDEDVAVELIDADAELIVAAVNDRDRFRGIVRRLLDSVDAMHALITRLNPNMMPVGNILPPETTVLGVDVGNAVREARAAIGEGGRE